MYVYVVAVLIPQFNGVALMYRGYNDKSSAVETLHLEVFGSAETV